MWAHDLKFLEYSAVCNIDRKTVTLDFTHPVFIKANLTLHNIIFNGATRIIAYLKHTNIPIMSSSVMDESEGNNKREKILKHNLINL